MKVGVIRVLTTTNEDLLNAHGRALADAYGYSITSHCIPGQFKGVYDDKTFQAAVPKIVALAEQLSPDVDALIVSCAADPGLAEAIQAVQIPVVGAGSAAAAMALKLGTAVGVLDLTPTTPAAIADVLGNHLVATVTPAGVNATTDLLTPEGRDATIDAARELIEAGADVILLGCTGMTSIGVAADLRNLFMIPVVDAVLAAGAALLPYEALQAHTVAGADEEN